MNLDVCLFVLVASLTQSQGENASVFQVAKTHFVTRETKMHMYFRRSFSGQIGASSTWVNAVCTAVAARE